MECLEKILILNVALEIFLVKFLHILNYLYLYYFSIFLADIESSLKVSGYDPSFNQYDIAKLFFEYKILQVNLLLDYAVVVLGSKFQAAHAALRHRKDSVASDSDIKITALGDEVNREIASFDLDVTYSDNYVT